MLGSQTKLVVTINCIPLSIYFKLKVEVQAIDDGSPQNLTYNIHFFMFMGLLKETRWRLHNLQNSAVLLDEMKNLH